MPIESLKWLFAPALLLMVVAAALCRYRSRHPFRIRRVLGSALLFGLLGPPIGALVLGIPLANFHRDPEPFRVLAFLMAASYLVALVPAMVGGACAGLLRPMLGPIGRLAAVAACCGLASGLFAYGLMADGAGQVVLMMGGLGPTAAAGDPPRQRQGILPQGDGDVGHERGVQLPPGKPNQNAYIESFNGRGDLSNWCRLCVRCCRDEQWLNPRMDVRHIPC